MMQFVLSLACLSALLLAFDGMSRLLGQGSRDWSERVAAGAVALAFLVGCLVWLEFPGRAVLWACLAVPAAFAIRRPAKPSMRILIPVLAGLVLLFPLAAMPPMARDALDHHLYLPRLWLDYGRMVRPGWAGYFSYPYLVELLYCLTGATLGFARAGMVSLAGFLAALFAVMKSAEDFRKGTGLLAGVLLLSMPEALRNATWAYSDSFLVLFSVLAWRELIRPAGSPLRASAWAASAAACKYNGIVILLAVAAAIPVRFRPKPSVLLACAGIVAAISASWAVPNLVEHHNPVYPLLGRLFGTSRQLTGESRQLLADYSEFSAPVGSVLDLVALPARLATGGEWDDPRQFDGPAGPLILLGTALFLIFGPRRRLALLPAFCLVASIGAGWPAVRVRYLLPCLAMLAVPAASGLRDALGRRGVVGVLAAVCFAVCLGWTGSRLLRLYASERPWEAGRPGFLESRLPFMRFYEISDSVLEAGDTTLFLNMGNRAFYFPGYVVYEETRFPLPVLDRIWRGLDADSIASEMRSSGIGYLAVDMSVSEINMSGLLDARGFGTWRDFVARKLDPVVSEGPYILFRLEAEKAPRIRLRSSPSSDTLTKSTGMEERASI